MSPDPRTADLCGPIDKGGRGAAAPKPLGGMMPDKLYRFEGRLFRETDSRACGFWPIRMNDHTDYSDIHGPILPIFERFLDLAPEKREQCRVELGG